VRVILYYGVVREPHVFPLELRVMESRHCEKMGSINILSAKPNLVWV
jgi:hypothetical protein